ncbi:hypothetical protein RvY_15918-2 [Ramazzottius varieornatus]|uniref:Uncharacterized protein n=1 Tax=Ramazzottius varieornatus TaxID=947166 RepID=A0A1D1VWL5_RAMVA|nr:hypothetical protein RvY_15918-2 [Ramazzottius varieornatus]
MPDHEKEKGSHHGKHSDKHHHEPHDTSSSHSDSKHGKKHHSKTNVDKADNKPHSHHHHSSKATLDVPGHNVHGGGHKHHEHGHENKEHHSDKHKHHYKKDADAADILSDKSEHKVLMTIQALPHDDDNDKKSHHHKHKHSPSEHHGSTHRKHEDKHGKNSISICYSVNSGEPARTHIPDVQSYSCFADHLNNMCHYVRESFFDSLS